MKDYLYISILYKDFNAAFKLAYLEGVGVSKYLILQYKKAKIILLCCLKILLKGGILRIKQREPELALFNDLMGLMSG
jgi:hypothetical protein